MSKIDQERLQAKLAQYGDREVTRVKIGLTDIDGVIRGKYISLDKFTSILASGGGFCDCLFGWDVDDQLYDRAAFTGWHTGFPDAKFRLIVDSERWLPDEGVPYFIGEFTDADGGPHPICPRSLLSVQLQRLKDQGFTLLSGFEYEFFVFRESPLSVREKNYHDLIPLTPGNFGYSVLRSSAESELFSGLMEYARSIDCHIEGLHCETGAGVWEAAMTASPGMQAADRAALFKTFAKVFFQQRDLMATFMAKWSMDFPGQSGHFHFSFLDEAGDNPFFDAKAPAHISQSQRYVIAGLQNYLRELLVMVAPTINSYTRLVKGAWAPTAGSWGVENRTAAIRVVGGSAGSQRIECRVPGADSNPYLVSAAVIAAALKGIEDKREPNEAVVGSAYDVQDDLPQNLQFASNLRNATEHFAASKMAREAFGDQFVDHFATSREWECREYERHINSWQLQRYFEII